MNLMLKKRLISFPVELLENVKWISDPIDSGSTRKILRQIADDFLLGRAKFMWEKSNTNRVCQAHFTIGA